MPQPVCLRMCQDSSVGRFLRFDLVINGSNPRSAKLSRRARRVASSVIPDIGITRCCHIDMKDLDTGR